jgi:circadian clock protein KaiC
MVITNPASIGNVSQGEYLQSGVPGVDDLLEGKGLPRGYNIFVLGSPGSGKTTFGLQFLHTGVTKFEENGIYISLDEDIPHVKTNAARIGFDFEPLERQNKVALVDASPIRRLPRQLVVDEYRIGKKDFTLDSLLDIVKTQVKRIDAKRLVIDPLVSLTLQFPDEVERRGAILDLMGGTWETGSTSLLISELAESGPDRRYQFEEFLAEGIILMRKRERVAAISREFTVEKMRGLAHDDQPRPYKILKGGIVVYPKETVL